MKDKKRKREIIARHSGPVTVLKWRDIINVTMVSTYHSADTQRVSNKGKETEKSLCMIIIITWGESICRTSCYTYMVERKKITKCYLKLFKRLLNSTVLNSFVVYQQVTGRNIQQLLYRIQLVEGLFTKYAQAAEKWTAPG